MRFAGAGFRCESDRVTDMKTVGFLLFSLIILLYWVITEIFTILFRFTGIPDEKARFQVASLLTGCGFTTKESEIMLSNRSRRRLARITMLFGYVFNITIVSIFINFFLSLTMAQDKHFAVAMLIPLVPLAIVFLFIRVPSIRAWGDRILENLVDRIIRSDSSNTVLPLDYIGKNSIALVSLKTVPEEFRELTLSETGLRANTGIMVMLVESKGNQAKAPDANTVFREGDRLTVFGDYTAICRSFHAREKLTDF